MNVTWRFEQEQIILINYDNNYGILIEIGKRKNEIKNEKRRNNIYVQKRLISTHTKAKKKEKKFKH